MTVWFTVQLEDQPGSLARVATALAERRVNITGIVGVAEDTDGALMLTTSDADATARPSARWASPSRSTTRPPASSPSVDVRRGLSPRPVAGPDVRGRAPVPGRSPGGPTAGRDPPRLRRPRPGDRLDRRRASPRSAARVRTFSPCAASTASRRSVEIELEVEGARRRTALLAALDGHTGRPGGQRLTRALDRVFGKRVIVVGGGAQVAQVALGAVSEADRHNLRGERISVDTIPLVGEEHRGRGPGRRRPAAGHGSSCWPARSWAATSRGPPRSCGPSGIPIIALNMVGSITEPSTSSSRTRSRPARWRSWPIADTAIFDLARQRGRRY